MAASASSGRERRQHVGGRHHLLHELAVIGRRGLQRGVGIGQLGLRVGDLLVQCRPGLVGAPGGTLPGGALPASASRCRYSSASLSPASCRRRIASATLGSRALAASRAAASSISRLVTLSCASSAVSNISASSV